MAISNTAINYGLSSTETSTIDGTALTATVGRATTRVPMSLVDIGYTVTCEFDGTGDIVTLDLETGAATGDVTGVKAAGTITFSGLPVADETVTVNGVVFTFKATATTSTEITIGADANETASNAAGKIDAYNAEVDAVAVGAVVTVSAENTGTYGNAYTLAEAATNTTVSGATLSGGVDAVIISGDGVDYLGAALATAAKIHGLLVYAPSGSAEVAVSGVLLSPVTSTGGVQVWDTAGRTDLIANLTIESTSDNSEIKVVVRASE